jgi:phenylalanine ammonia-lyase
MFKRETTANEITSTIQIDGNPLSLNKFSEITSGTAAVTLLHDEALDRKMAASVDVVNDALIDDEAIYGITTGFGGMSNQRIDCQSVANLQANLLTFLAASAGPEIDPCHTLGAMLLRSNVLLQGKSGVRLELVERLLRFVQRQAVPVVRELGSIGASGDLVPLSTIARAITGTSDRVQIRLDGDLLDSKQTLQRLKLKPLSLRAKEGLALVNGTSFSCAIAANASIATRHSLSLYFAIESLLLTAMKVNPAPFAAFVHDAKPHPGQGWSAQTMRQLLYCDNENDPSGDVQDRYSLRCFPQYSGSIVEGLARIERVVEIEMNSVSDNPLIDTEDRKFHQSGNFLGQYIGIAMDDLRRYIGLMAKHLDVQIASLVAPEFNRGLSPSLVGNPDTPFNMGLKGLQICANSIMPMLTWMANPIVEHFPTHAEQFNQNINGLSWGAANMAWKSASTFQQYLAIASLFAIQAVDLRCKSACGHFDGRELLGPEATDFYNAVCQVLAVEPSAERPWLFDDSDRWLEQDIELLANDIAKKGKLVRSVSSITASFEAFCGSQS